MAMGSSAALKSLSAPNRPALAISASAIAVPKLGISRLALTGRLAAGTTASRPVSWTRRAPSEGGSVTDLSLK